MKKTAPDQDSARETRMDEIEIKLAFLEKELEEYKEASRTAYRRMAEMEEELKSLKRELPEGALPAPEATWDAENQSVRT